MCWTAIFRSRCPICSTTIGRDVSFEKFCEPSQACAERDVRPLRFRISESPVPCAVCLAERLEREVFLAQLTGLDIELEAVKDDGDDDDDDDDEDEEEGAKGEETDASDLD